MKKTSKRSLMLSTQTLRVLAGSDLRAAVGGTQLVTVDDPVTGTRTFITTHDSCLKPR